MNEVIKLYRIGNYLSLDVVAGAITGSLFFAKVYEVTPSVTSLIALGLTVWIIYTADRLLDIRYIKHEATSGRHRFHQKNQKILTGWLWLMIVIDMALIFFMPVNIIKNGIVLSLIVIVYILLGKRLYIFKEFLIAILYTAGVVLPAWPENGLSTGQYTPIVLFFIIALINLILFSWYEKVNDLKDHQHSVATLVEDRTIQYILTGLFAVAFSISFFMFVKQAFYFMALVLMVMTAILFILFKYNKYFSEYEYYRVVGDSVFFVPIVYLLT